MVTSTDTRADEDAVLTTACGLLDRSDRGKLALTGPDAKAFLHGQVTQDIEALTPGRGAYAAFLTPKGRILGDLRVLDAGGELLLDTERATLQALFNLIHRFRIGRDVQLHKRTVERGLLSLIGPTCDAVLGSPELGPDEHHNVTAEIDGRTVLLVRTDLGVDVLCRAEDTAPLTEALTARGAGPVSDAAAEVLRVESGRPRTTVDLDERTIPQEAGLNERAVSFTKGCYVGQETVARLFYRGSPNRNLRGLRLDGPADPGEPLLAAERDVGRLGSVVHSPRHGWIALALVRKEAPAGTVLSVGAGPATATVVELPFTS